MKLRLSFSLVVIISVTLLAQTKSSCPNIHILYESDSLSSFLSYNGFVVRYNFKKKVPEYTINCLTVEQVTNIPGIKVKRRNSFFVDDRKLKGYSATNLDYKKSRYDRGHLVPAGDFVNNQKLKDETFVYSNIAPQNSILNRGIWAYLEDEIRKRVLNSSSPAWIITGTVFNSTHEIIGDKVGAPNYFYKIVFIPKMEHMYAFLFDNYISSYSNNLVNYQTNVNCIERIVDSDFFDKLEDTMEEKMESMNIPFIMYE